MDVLGATLLDRKAFQELLGEGAGGKASPGIEMDRGVCQRKGSGQPGTAEGEQVIQLEISICRNCVLVPELTQLSLFFFC